MAAHHKGNPTTAAQASNPNEASPLEWRVAITLPPRPLLKAIVVSLAAGTLGFAFLIAALATPVLEFKNCSDWGCIDVAQTYRNLAVNKDLCGSLRFLAGFALAITIIGTLLAFGSMCVSVVAITTRRMSLPLVSSALLGAASVCTLIAGPAAISLYTAPLCDGIRPFSEYPYAKIGPSGILLLFNGVLLTAGCVVGVILHQRAVAEMTGSLPTASTKEYGTASLIQAEEPSEANV